jgi:hypothetical protein
MLWFETAGAAVAIGAPANVKAVANKNAGIAIMAHLRFGRSATLLTIPTVGCVSEELINFSSAGQLLIIVPPALLGGNPP